MPHRAAQHDAIAGVDGCRGGWLCIAQVQDAPLTATLFATIDELVAAALALHTVAIDMPIGLSDSGARAADTELRCLLGARRSSVFPMPARAALAGVDYAHACALSQAASGKRLSRQTYGILPKIRALDDAVRADPRLRAILHETHPEASFLHLNRGAPMAHAKKSAAGFDERWRRLEAVWPGAFATFRASFRRKDVLDDDILDAMALLWSAQRIAAGRAMRLPREPQFDRFGLRMEVMA